MDISLELIAVPVSDTNRAKKFYAEKLGFHVDVDHQVNDKLRFVQLTPPGSACSIVIGEGTTTMRPGSQKGLQAVVKDALTLHKTLTRRGVQVSGPEKLPWGTFLYVEDPDGNRWSFQQLPAYRADRI